MIRCRRILFAGRGASFIFHHPNWDWGFYQHHRFGRRNEQQLLYVREWNAMVPSSDVFTRLSATPREWIPIRWPLMARRSHSCWGVDEEFESHPHDYKLKWWIKYYHFCISLIFIYRDTSIVYAADKARRKPFRHFHLIASTLCRLQCRRSFVHADGLQLMQLNRKYIVSSISCGPIWLTGMSGFYSFWIST